MGAPEGVRPSWDCSAGFGAAVPRARVAATTRRPTSHTCSNGSRDTYGVEAFVEPKTTVTDLTVVLVAGDGEWTRRRAGGDAGADG